LKDALEKLSHIDLSDDKTKAIVCAATVGTVLAVGGAVYYLNKSDDKPEGDEECGEAAVEDVKAERDEYGLPVIESAVIEPVETDPVALGDKKKSEGNQAFKTGDYAVARMCYEQAIDLYPSDKAVEKSACYQNIAAVYDKMNKLEEVIKNCTRALQLNQKYIKALTRRAGAYEKTEKYAESIKDLTAICLVLGIEKAYKEGYTDTTDRVLKLYGKQAARELFQGRVPFLPSHTVVNSALDNLHLRDFEVGDDEDLGEGDQLYVEVLKCIRSKSYDTVYDTILQGLKLGATKYRTQLRCLQGIFSWLMTDYKTALECFDEVIADKESFVRIKIQAYLHRGEVYQAKSEQGRALVDYNTAIQLDEDHPDAYLHRGQFYLSIERFPEAIQDLEICIKLDENFCAPWQQLVYGQYQYAAKSQSPHMLEQVFSKIEKMTGLFPNVPDVYALYGQVLQDQKQFAAAEMKYREAMKLSPHNVTYKVHLAILKMMAEGSLDQAIELLLEATAQDPKCDFALETLGTIYIQKENYADALECFTKALEFVKTEPEAAHAYSMYIGVKCQKEVCEEYNVRPVSVKDVQGYSEMLPGPN